MCHLLVSFYFSPGGPICQDPFIQALTCGLYCDRLEARRSTACNVSRSICRPYWLQFLKRQWNSRVRANNRKDPAGRRGLVFLEHKLNTVSSDLDVECFELFEAVNLVGQLYLRSLVADLSSGALNQVLLVPQLTLECPEGPYRSVGAIVPAAIIDREAGVDLVDDSESYIPCQGGRSRAPSKTGFLGSHRSAPRCWL